MNSKARIFLSRALAGALILFAIASCSTVSKGDGAQITKVKYYHLQPQERIRGSDPTILFERDYHLHGAVTLAQQMERAGHYYNVAWKADDRSQPVTVRFEYRQRNTGLKSKKMEQEVADLGRVNNTKFQVTGAEYQSDGPVSAWKVTLLRGKQELVAQESFLWK
jgi:hypothetical protein